VGTTRFAVAGHDRGGRVAYRMALDHPDRINAAACLTSFPPASSGRAPLPALCAERISGAGRAGSHFFAEDEPEHTASELLAFFETAHNCPT
jgi:poly(3-hydroxybutyrate) depolymerase